MTRKMPRGAEERIGRKHMLNDTLGNARVGYREDLLPAGSGGDVEGGRFRGLC